ncbi:spermatogenesis-associated protein 7 homolog [Bufo gargarizans]|uniref:spermatogenesis-associated protein 7 homolog n=1 Tax=Bufo gargarizans TaxID=30331 RepID=UPI001CF2B4F0|nr:spermatogenesis-associated protein 7 homolog [Bufo gargarizans]
MSSIMIPKYSMTGPFKGHRSTKSSPLFPGSSCSLSSQFLIQDHMSTHYRKLNSAKAAVDTSAPRSLSSSIKYRDQQNRERLLRAVEKFKKELQEICSTFRYHSQSNFPEEDTVRYGHQKPPVNQTEKLLDVHKTRSQIYSPAVTVREVMGHIEKEPCDVNVRTSTNRSPPRKKPYKDPLKKTYSGDLLDKHPASFTSTNEPFKPRLLKKPSKSFVSNYKYYMAPRKKSLRRTSSGQVHLQDKRSLEKCSHTTESRAEKQGNMVERTRKEDLKYLCFLENLTNDIIQRGCRSHSAMERVFQDHLHRKQPNIDNLKKKILVEELRDELERSVKLDFAISYDGTQYGSGNLPLQRNLNRLLTAP